jgi:hypothetical protein
MNVSGTSANSVTVTKPSQTADGDLMLAVTVGPVATVTPPAGWTLLGSFTDTTVQSNLYKKIASSEGASYAFSFSVSSAVGAFVCSFVGGYDVTLWDARAEGTDITPVTNRIFPARDSSAFSAVCWADTVTNSATANQGTEQFDTVSANTGSTIFRGMAGYMFGPPSSTDIINTGDSLPNTTFTLASAPTGCIAWVVAVGDKPLDTEPWSSTDGDFDVELKLDEVAADSVGDITTTFRGDITGAVSAVTSRGEAGGADENLTDGLLSTKWQDSSATSWVVYDFGANTTKTVRRYRLSSSADTPARDPMNWQFQGSQNSSDWTTLDTRTNESFATRGETREYRVTTTGAYRYYRLNITANQSSGATAEIALSEFRVSSIEVWENITTYVNEESKIRITRGVQGPSGRSDFSRAYVELNNTDGRFSLRKQDGEYYGALQRNNQMRISKAFGTKSLQLQGDVLVAGTNVCGDAVMCPLTSALSITGDIDIRIDLEPESWRDEQMLCGTEYAGDDALGFGDEGWSLFLDGLGVPHLTWHDGTNFFDVSAELAVPQKTRQALRVTLDVDNGAAGKTLTFYTADTISGPWTQLGDVVTQDTTTSISYTGGTLRVGHVSGRDQRGVHGRVYHFELYTGIAGTAVTDIDFTALTNGAHSFTDSNSNRWITVNNAVVSNRQYRFYGEVAEWPVSWDPTGTWIVTSATGAGVQRRLERGNSPASVMRRYHTKGIISDPGAFERFATPYAYWPLEDQEGAFELASGLPSKPAMQIYGSPDWEGTDGGKFNESDELIKLNGAKYGGRIVGNPRDYADIRWIQYSPTAMPNASLVMEGYSSGFIVRFSLTYAGADDWRFDGYAEGDAGTAFVSSALHAIPVTGEAAHMRLLLADDGTGDLDVTMTAYDTSGVLLGTWTETFAATTMGRVYRVNVNPDGDVVDSYVGHLAVYGADSPEFTEPINAYHYETAGNRIHRLCKEEGIGFRHIGTLSETGFMGYQTVTTPFPAMSSAAVTDDGFLIDPLDAFGIEYRTTRSMYGQAAHLTLSYTGNELSGEMRPQDDDSYILNDFTANRGGAGGARFRRTDGKLSVNAPPYGVGPYEDSQSYSVAHEGQCVDLASWHVYRGTLDEERYTRIEVALENLRITADTALAERILLIDVGDRVDVTDTPDFLESDDIRQIVVGYEEWFDKFQHSVKLNTLPERIYEVAEYDAWRHFDADASLLSQDITAAAEQIVIDTDDAPQWTSDVEAMPFDVRVDGEVMRVVAPGSLINENPFFDSTVSDWTAQNCTIARSTDYVHPHPDALASLKITPDGSLGNANALAPEPDVVVTAGNRYLASGWVFAPAGYDSCRITVSWFDSGGGFLSTSTVTADSVPAADWTFIREELTAPASATAAQIVCGQTNSPTGSEITYWWAVRLVQLTSISNAWYTADTFDRTDSLTTPGSTNGGLSKTWTESSGTWGIISNTAYITASADSIMTLTWVRNIEWMEVTVPTWTSGTAHLVFRYTDGSNYLRFGGTVAGQATLEQVVAGVATSIAVADDNQGLFTLAAGDTLAISCHDSVIEGYVNGRLAVSVSDTTQESATIIGLRLTTNVPRLNNFYADAFNFTQTYTVERGRNGAASYHKANTSVFLSRTPYRGL